MKQAIAVTTGNAQNLQISETLGTQKEVIVQIKRRIKN